MNSKDLLSINEAFAKASSKVTTDEPAKKDEVVTEGTENVNEFAGSVARGAGNVLSAPLRAVGAIGRGVKKGAKKLGDTLDQRRDDRKAGKALRKHRERGEKRKDEGTEEAVLDKDTVKCDHPGCKDGKHTDGSDCKKCNGDGWISANDKLEKEASEMDNIMGNYENMLSKNFGVKNVKEKADSKGFKKPDEKVSEVDSKTQRPKGEVNAEEKSKDVGGAKEDLQEPIESTPKEEEKKPKNEKKLAKESINNCNKGNIMSEDKSIFDKLYESVMGEDDDFELGIPGDDAPGDPGDEFGDEGGDEVTVTLTPDQAAALKAVVDQLPSDEEDPGDDIGADDPLADTDELEDSVQEDNQQTGDGKKPGVDPSDGGGKATDPAADSLGGKSSGDGAVPVTDEEGSTQTGDGKKPGVAKNSGKPGKLAV